MKKIDLLSCLVLFFLAFNVKCGDCKNPVSVGFTAIQSFFNNFFTNGNPACLRFCDLNYRPVCGSDGITYYNACFFAVSQCNDDSLMLGHLGECGVGSYSFHKTYFWKIPYEDKSSQCRKPCDKTYFPICGSDGITYSNVCLFGIAQCMYNDVFLSHLGPCLTPEISQIAFDVRDKSEIDRCNKNCEKIYDPVCGSNYMTYDSYCSFEVASCLDTSIQVMYFGSCEYIPNLIMKALLSNEKVDSHLVAKCSRPCPRNYSPICTDAGVTASNKCEFEYMQCIFPELKEVGSFPCDNIPALYRPRSLSKPKVALDFSILKQCSKSCRFDGHAVCGSNGYMFKNNCEFEVGSCIDKSVEIAEDFGVCKGNVEFLKNQFGASSLDCPKTWNPVCGSNSVTYPNLCFFMLDLQYDDALYVKSAGECVFSKQPVAYSEYCYNTYTMSYRPVCDVHNIPHFNECSLIYSQPADSSTLSTPGYCGEQDFQHYYPQCIKPCPLNYDPVCGSDGVTYGNFCAFEARQCMDKNLALVSHDSCQNSAIDQVKHKLLCMRYCAKVEVDYVCGNNDITYLNTCHFENARCRTPELRLASLGKCPSTPECQIDCSESQADTLVCGSDLVTYENTCEYEKAKCINKDLEISYVGSCALPSVNNSNVLVDKSCLRVCPLILLPVCGSDHVTYSNMCLFETAQCKDSELLVLNEGRCDINLVS